MKDEHSIMKNVSTGTGLSLLAVAVLGSTIVIRFGPTDQAVHAAPLAYPWIAAAAQAPTPPLSPTGAPISFAVMPSPSGKFIVMYRLWSHGGVDRRLALPDDGMTFEGGWRVVP
jgi:hypothetical protein